MAWYWMPAGAVAVTVAALGIASRRRGSSGRDRRPPGRVSRAAAPDNWALRYSLQILLAGGLAAAAAFFLAYRATEGADKDRFDVGVKAATAIVATAAGVLTWGRLDLSRREHRLAIDRDLTERYGRAADQLGSDDALIRAAGAFALERFALDAFALGGLDNDVDWRMALDLLVDFIRQARPLPDHRAKPSATEQPDKHATKTAPTSPAIPVDVTAALRAVARFNTRSNTPEPVPLSLALLDLAGADLAGANLARANLAGAILAGADLIDANLTGAGLPTADLTNAILDGANLHSADLSEADLSDAGLTGADLTNADLARAILTNADLTDAVLTDVDLNEADLDGATLTGADIARADLRGANLHGANLHGVDLARAILTDAVLTDAILTDVDLTNANLDGVDLTNANLDGATVNGANLRGADLAGVVGAVFSSDSTVWPKGVRGGGPPSGLVSAG